MTHLEKIRARFRNPRPITMNPALPGLTCVVVVMAIGRPAFSQSPPRDLGAHLLRRGFPSTPHIPYRKNSGKGLNGALWFRLDRRGNSISDDDLAQLVGQTELWALDIGRTPINGSGFVHLQNLNLHALRLHRTQITDESLAVLEPLQRLQLLDLSVAPITDAAMVHVAKLENLTWLELNLTNISDAGIAALEPLEKLEVIELRKTRITDAALKELEKLPHLGSVRLSSPYLTSSGVKAFRESRRNVRVSFEVLTHDQADPPQYRLPSKPRE